MPLPDVVRWAPSGADVDRCRVRLGVLARVAPADAAVDRCRVRLGVLARVAPAGADVDRCRVRLGVLARVAPAGADVDRCRVRLGVLARVAPADAAVDRCRVSLGVLARVAPAGGAVDRCRLAPLQAAVVFGSIGPAGRAGKVKIDARCRAVHVGEPSVVARWSRQLSSWVPMPDEWLHEPIPDDYAGKALAALAYLRGASWEWIEADGSIKVDGRYLIADDARVVVGVKSADKARAILDYQAAKLTAIMAAKAYAVSGPGGQVAIERARKAVRVQVLRASKAVHDLSIGIGQRRALEVDLNWRQRRV